MKKSIITALLLGLCALGHATVTIQFQVGLLADATGLTPVADNTLIQFYASPDTTFSGPTAGAFSSGNDVQIFSGNFDSSTSGTTGAMVTTLTGLSSAIASNYLFVVWYPTLSGSASSPGASTPYGIYGYSLSDTSWVAPADGGSTTVALLTTSSGFGSATNSLGYATLTTAAIPEPSTYAAILGALALGFVAYRRRRQAA